MMVQNYFNLPLHYQKTSCKVYQNVKAIIHHYHFFIGQHISCLPLKRQYVTISSATAACCCCFHFDRTRQHYDIVQLVSSVQEKKMPCLLKVFNKRIADALSPQLKSLENLFRRKLLAIFSPKAFNYVSTVSTF